MTDEQTAPDGVEIEEPPTEPTDVPRDVAEDNDPED